MNWSTYEILFPHPNDRQNRINCVHSAFVLCVFIQCLWQTVCNMLINSSLFLFHVGLNIINISKSYKSIRTNSFFYNLALFGPQPKTSLLVWKRKSQNGSFLFWALSWMWILSLRYASWVLPFPLKGASRRRDNIVVSFKRTCYFLLNEKAWWKLTSWL